MVNKMLAKGEVIDFMRGYGHSRADTMILLGIDLPDFERITDLETIFVPRSLVVKIVERVMEYEALHGEPIDYFAESAA